MTDAPRTFELPNGSTLIVIEAAAVRRLEEELCVIATSPDGLAEVVERADRRFARGLQRYPHDRESTAGARISEALVDSAGERGFERGGGE